MTPVEVPVSLVNVENLRKTYRLGRTAVPVLRGVELEVMPGEWVAILGASGSGKSTLLHLIGGLDRPDRRGPDGEPGGEVRFEGRALASYSAHELDRYRAERVGFVFQFYHLLPELTVTENVLLGAMIRHGMAGYRRRRQELRQRAGSLLDSMGLGERLGHRPVELSGGERQRVAIARALINRPALLLADEPTGNLDRKTGDSILDSMARVRGELQQTMLMVTHDAEVAARADRIIRLEDGKVAHGAAEGEPAPA